VVAGAAAAIVGALPAALAAAGVVTLTAGLSLSPEQQLLVYAVVAIAGIVASAWGGVALMRCWYERQASGGGTG
jgi:hypothetical protein